MNKWHEFERVEAFMAVTRKNVSATEPNRLMLYKISRFHGGDNGECHLLGYNPVRTSQETLFLRYRALPVNAI
jgi:hypothetical protein